MRDVVAKLHYLHAISLKPLYLLTNSLPFSAPTRTYRMYASSSVGLLNHINQIQPKSERKLC